MVLRDALAFLALLAAACARTGQGDPTAQRTTPGDATTPPPAESAPASGPEPGATELPALAGEWLEALRDGDDELGFAAIPLGTRSRRPIVIGLHGALGDPAVICSEWRAIFGPEPFILCPHGARVNAHSFVWGSPEQMRAAIDRIVDLAESKYPQRIERRSAVWASHSQSGILAGRALRVPGLAFKYAVLFEGVPADPAPLRGAFERAGITRALFVCQRAGWSAAHRAAAAAVGPRAEGRFVYLGPFGHFFRAESFEPMSREVAWLTAEDPLWTERPPEPGQKAPGRVTDSELAR